MNSRKYTRQSYTTKESPWKPHWFSNFQVAGKFQIPVMNPHTFTSTPTGVNSLHREPVAETRTTRILHGFEYDELLKPILNSPQKYLIRYSKYLAITTPDFSILTEMPPQDRVRSVWISRALGAYFQSHGLAVIPTIRWAKLDDFEFVLDGLTTGGAIAISSQSLTCDRELREIFNKGCEIVTSTLQPRQIIFYGNMTSNSRQILSTTSLVWQFRTDISQVHRKQLP